MKPEKINRYLCHYVVLNKVEATYSITLDFDPLFADWVQALLPCRNSDVQHSPFCPVPESTNNTRNNIANRQLLEHETAKSNSNLSSNHRLEPYRPPPICVEAVSIKLQKIFKQVLFSPQWTLESILSRCWMK